MYVCEDCGRECGVHVEDVGIGPGEAHGVPFNHVEYQLESTCCRAGVLDESGNEYTYHQYALEREENT